MSQWKRVGALKIGLLILLVFVLGITVGLGQSPKGPSTSGGIYEELRVFTDVLGLLQKAIEGRNAPAGS